MNIAFENFNTVIFDLGNVLVHYDSQHCLDQYTFHSDIRNRVKDAMFRSNTWWKGDQGIYGPHNWCDAFVANDPGIESEIRLVYDGLQECILPTDYTNDLIRFFRKKGYRIYYLSNYSEGLYEKTKDRLSFIESFDGGVFSWKENCLKPDPKIYQTLLNRYQIEPSKSLFFDDVKENVKAACVEGIYGIVFTPDLAFNILHKQ